MDYKVFNEEFKARVERHFKLQGFMDMLGVELTAISPGRVEASLLISDPHRQQKGFVHGGIVASIADVVAGFAAYTLVPADHNVVTGEIKVSYLNPGVGDRLWAKGWVLKQGRKLNFCEAEVWCNNAGKDVLIAKATTSMITLFPGDIAPR